jgi:hypothetical protein
VRRNLARACGALAALILSAGSAQLALDYAQNDSLYGEGWLPEAVFFELLFVWAPTLGLSMLFAGLAYLLARPSLSTLHLARQCALALAAAIALPLCVLLYAMGLVPAALLMLSVGGASLLVLVRDLRLLIALLAVVVAPVYLMLAFGIVVHMTAAAAITMAATSYIFYRLLRSPNHAAA